MKHLKYKDYVGSVEFDVEENILFGKLLHIRDLISYEGTDIKSLQAAFEEAVDEYLEDCAAEGLDADRPFKGSFNVRLAPDLHRELALVARSREISLNEHVSQVLSLHKNGGSIATSVVSHFQKWMSLAADEPDLRPLASPNHLQGQEAVSKSVDRIATLTRPNVQYRAYSPMKTKVMQ